MLRVLFGFEGRIGRRNYWLAILGQWALLTGMFFAFSTAITAAFLAIGVDLTPGAAPPDLDKLGEGDVLLAGGLGIATAAFLFAVLGMSIYMSVAAQVKRLHDMNLSGWVVLVNFASLPIAATLFASDPANGPIALFVMMIPFGLGLACGFFPGTHGPNNFGADRISIFDVSSRTDESWADRAQAHREQLKAQQDIARPRDEDDDEPAPKPRSGPQRRSRGPGKKGFGRRGMA